MAIGAPIRATATGDGCIGDSAVLPSTVRSGVRSGVRRGIR